jgi:invasion protein IalB
VCSLECPTGALRICIKRFAVQTEFKQLLGLLLVLVGFVVAGVIYHSHVTQNVPATDSERQIPTLQTGAVLAPDRPQWVTASIYGNWKFRCRAGVTQATKKTSCVGIIDVVDRVHQQVVLLWAIGRNGKGGLTMNVQTPTGVVVSAGIGLKLDNERQPRALPYQSCDQQSCSVVYAMDQNLILALGRAKRADITLHTTAGKDVAFHIPLAGTDKVLETLE